MKVWELLLLKGCGCLVALAAVGGIVALIMKAL